MANRIPAKPAGRSNKPARSKAFQQVGPAATVPAKESPARQAVQEVSPDASSTRNARAPQAMLASPSGGAQLETASGNYPDEALLHYLAPATAAYAADYVQCRPGGEGTASFHFLAYCILRACNLAHEMSLNLADSPAVAEQLGALPSLFASAEVNPCLTRWPQRIALYLATRLLGAEHEQALLDSWGGFYWMRYSFDPAFKQGLDKLYDEYMVPLTPKSMPRIIANATLVPLGAGNFNAVSLVELPDPDNGNQMRKFVFKPSDPNSRRGWGAQVTGIQNDIRADGPDDGMPKRVIEKNYHPECRTIGAYNLLHALGVDGYVERSFMAVINGTPGVLTAYVEGPLNPSTGRAEDPRTAGTFKDIEITDKRLCKYLRKATRNELRDLEGMLGTTVTAGKRGRYSVDGVVRNIDLALWNQPTFRGRYADAAFVRRILNDQDGHTENFLGGIDSDGRLRVILIDLDQALGPHEPHPGVIPPGYAMFATINERHLSRNLEQAFHPENHAEEIRDALLELLDEDEVDANIERLQRLRQQIDNRVIIVIDRPEDWMDPQFDDPAVSVLGRHRILLGERLLQASKSVLVFDSESDSD